jgi:hypothetical protein
MERGLTLLRFIPVVSFCFVVACIGEPEPAAGLEDWEGVDDEEGRALLEELSELDDEDLELLAELEELGLLDEGGLTEKGSCVDRRPKWKCKRVEHLCNHSFVKRECCATCRGGVPSENNQNNDNVDQRFERAKDRMREYAQSTRSGRYFPNVRVPQNLEGYRDAMVTYGNLARRDPNWRRNAGATIATDLSGTRVRTLRRGEWVWDKIFKDNRRPPYFNDVTTHPQLDKACQWHAEYMATKQLARHQALGETFGPQECSMELPWDRAKCFGYDGLIKGEAAGAPSRQPGYEPHGILASKGHFRPWFNIGARIPYFGVGVAQGRDGLWYTCFLAGRCPNDEPCR